MSRKKKQLVLNMPENNVDLEIKSQLKNDANGATNGHPIIITKSDAVQNEKKAVIQIFEQCLDIMRKDGIVGFKALHNFCYFIVLKYIESQFGKEIDIDNFNYSNINELSEEDFAVRKNRLLYLARFSNLVKEPIENLIGITEALWDEVLSQHPTLSKFFQKGKWFDIQKPDANHRGNPLKCVKLLKQLFDKINEIASAKSDILGDAYEKVASNQVKGQALGQFFTPPDFKDYIIEKINPQLFPNGTFESCCDPAMGTAGFLTTFTNCIIKQSLEKKIPIDWGKSKKLIYGKEIEGDTFHLAFANLMLGTGHIFDHLDYGDSIHESILQQFDIIITNPPFGIKGLKYDSINCEQKEKYIPIQTDNAVWLFIQAVIYMLKIGGRAGVIVPCGQELFNDAFTIVRKYLMKTCELTQITLLPSDSFTYTTVKTCVFFFTKKKNDDDIMQRREYTKLRNPKLFYDYKFNNDDHETKSIKFYEFDKKEKNCERFIAEIPIEQIIKKNYCLDFSSYIKQDKKTYGSGVIFKKLGDICTIDYGTRILKKDNVDKNQFPVYGGGDIVFYTDKFNRNGFNILISRFGMSRNCLRLIDEKIFLNDSGLTVKPVNSTILHKFLGYYLHINQIEIYQCGRGAAQKNIDINKFKEIKIEIPSLEIQNEIVIYCDDQNRKIEELKKEIEQNKEMIKKHLTMVLEKCEKTEIQNDLIENTAGTITAENNTTATIENITIENTTIENITTATIENTTIESKNDKPDATKKPKRNSRKKTVPHNEGNCNEENNHREEDKIQDTKPQPRKRQPREKKEKKIIILDDFVDGDE